MIIYLAVNRVNRKAYVGQTTRSFHQRIRQHAKGGMLLTRAIQKYGIESFDICVLTNCQSKAALDRQEKRWIARLGSLSPAGYNIARGGGGALGVKHPHLAEYSKSPRARRLQSARMAGEGNPFFGKTHNKATKAKMRGPRPHLHGRKRRDVTKRNRSQVGKLNPMFGRFHTAEENKRNSELLTGAGNPRFGKRWTPRQRKLISQRTKAAMARPDVRSRFMRGIAGRRAA